MNIKHQKGCGMKFGNYDRLTDDIVLVDDEASNMQKQIYAVAYIGNKMDLKNHQHGELMYGSGKENTK